MKNDSGYSLSEFLIVVAVALVFTLVAIPLYRYQLSQEESPTVSPSPTISQETSLE